MLAIYSWESCQQICSRIRELHILWTCLFCPFVPFKMYILFVLQIYASLLSWFCFYKQIIKNYNLFSVDCYILYIDFMFLVSILLRHWKKPWMLCSLRSLVFIIAQCQWLIHVANLIYWDKSWLLLL